MKDRIGTIIENIEVADAIYKMTLNVDLTDCEIHGGQFVHILLNAKEHVLRRPFCICDFNRERNELVVCYAVIGDGTKILCKMKAFEQLSIMFPLGNGYIPAENEKKIVLLGGGMGSAVLPAIARAFPDRDYYTYLGFAKKSKVVLENEMTKLSTKLVIATDDGSYERKGFITNILKDDLKKINPDCIVCCGPAVMYKSLRKIVEGMDIPVYISLEQRMACGIGACLGCNCKIIRDGKEAYARVCKDGPVFKLDEVIL